MFSFVDTGTTKRLITLCGPTAPGLTANQQLYSPAATVCEGPRAFIADTRKSLPATKNLLIAAGAPEATAKSVVAQQETAGRLLYIEDNEANLRLIELAVQRLSPLKFIAAHDGASGLQMAQQQPLKVILLDLQLPDIGGKDVLYLLKKDPRTSAIPVVVVSADDIWEREGELRDAGAYGYLAKPVDLKQLQLMLNKIVTPNQRQNH